MFNFDYSYLSLPKKFYSLTKPEVNSGSKVFLLNDQISDEFKLKIKNSKETNKDQYLILSLFIKG